MANVSIHSANSNLMTHYLNLMQDRLGEARITDLYVSCIKSFPGNSAIKLSWAWWLTTVNRRDEAERVFTALMKEHPHGFNVPYAYARLLLDVERYEEAAKHFRQVLKIHCGHSMAHDGLAMALQGLAHRAEGLRDESEATRFSSAAEYEFRSAIYWAGVAQDKQAMFFTHLGWFYVERKRWSDAYGAFNQAAIEAPAYFGNYWGMGRALVGIEQWRDARSALHKAIETATDSLGPPASDDIQWLIRQCDAALTTDSQER